MIRKNACQLLLLLLIVIISTITHGLMNPLPPFTSFSFSSSSSSSFNYITSKWICLCRCLCVSCLIFIIISYHPSTNIVVNDPNRLKPSTTRTNPTERLSSLSFFGWDHDSQHCIIRCRLFGATRLLPLQGLILNNHHQISCVENRINPLVNNRIN